MLVRTTVGSANTANGTSIPGRFLQTALLTVTPTQDMLPTDTLVSMESLPWLLLSV